MVVPFPFMTVRPVEPLPRCACRKIHRRPADRKHPEKARQAVRTKVTRSARRKLSLSTAVYCSSFPPPLKKLYHQEKSAAARVAPVTIPRFLAVARIPEVMPRYSSLTLDKTEALLGDKKDRLSSPKQGEFQSYFHG